MSKESRQSYKQFQCLQDAMRADVAVAKQHGIDPVTAMAAECRLSNYAIHKWIEEERGIPAARLVTWAEVTGSDCALRYLIGEWGYEIVERRVSKPGAADIERESLPDAIGECSDVFRAVADALRDGEFSADEVRRIYLESAQAIQAIEQLCHDAEAALPAHHIDDGRCISLADTQRKARES